VDNQNGAQEALGPAPGAGGDEALARLTAALRAGLPGSGRGPDLLAAPADSDPFEVFASGYRPADAPVEPARVPPPASLASGAGMVERRVALMAQDMAAFGGVGREAPLRLESPGEGPRHEYFA
jgi:hypothetical protein